MINKAEANVIPKGYWQDAKGALIPESKIKPVDKARDKLVRELVKHSRKHSNALAQFKADILSTVQQFVDASAAMYGAKLGGKKGNINLHSFDGQYKVQVAIADHIQFDERLQAAKVLIDECILEWSKGSNANIKALVNQAFDCDKAGKLSVGKILGLRNLDIKDDRWLKAMQAISDSVTIVSSKSYVRFYERIDDSDEYRPISLDIAVV